MYTQSAAAKPATSGLAWYKGVKLILYYRIPAGLDGRAVVPAGAYCGKVKRYLIGGELYTAKECARYGISTAGLEPVTISQRRTFTNFGVRMEVHA